MFFMHGPHCTVQVQATNILLNRFVISLSFQCLGPTQLVLQIIGHAIMCVLTQMVL